MSSFDKYADEYERMKRKLMYENYAGSAGGAGSGSLFGGVFNSGSTAADPYYATRVYKPDVVPNEQSGALDTFKYFIDLASPMAPRAQEVHRQITHINPLILLLEDL